jgi:uncharacterized protein
MQILTDILKSIIRDAPIEEVRRGLHWTAVVSRHCGLASTMSQDICCNHDDSGKEGSLTGMTALELAQYCFSENISKASLGLASINSLIDVDRAKCADIDGLKFIYEIGNGKNISVIGHFPYLQDLENIASNIWIIEKHPKPGDLSEESGQDYLPRSDIVVISGTTLINHTLPGILSLCKEKSIKMLLGPTTPMSEVFFDHGIDILSGSMVTDKEVALKYISEGANFIRLKRSGAVRFVTMVRDREDIIQRTKDTA